MRKLSQGQCAEVALAQATCSTRTANCSSSTRPWSGLDSTAHATLRELLTETAEQGAAVAFTEHSDLVVRSTATRVCETPQRTAAPRRKQADR
jgi:ABC-type transport system involved in cytochrome c biogenesis ATPase subunit